MIMDRKRTGIAQGRPTKWGGVFKKDSGRELDGRTYDEFPVVPLVPVPA
jgi:protein gp37